MKKTKKVDPEVENLKNQLARALADYDNLEKRVARERETLSTIVLSKLVLRFLPVLDNLEHIQAHLMDPGLAIAIKEFHDSLKNEGIECINPQKGQVFDENMHEAVEVLKEDGLENNAIIEVVLPGWMTQSGLVLRPAKVKVNRKEENK